MKNSVLKRIAALVLAATMTVSTFSESASAMVANVSAGTSETQSVSDSSSPDSQTGSSLESTDTAAQDTKTIINSFDGFEAGSAYRKIVLNPGDTVDSLNLPKTIPAVVSGVSTELMADIDIESSDFDANDPSKLSGNALNSFRTPIVWNASEIDFSTPGTYRAYAVIADSSYEYAMSDNVFTFWVNEGELPYIDVTVPVKETANTSIGESTGGSSSGTSSSTTDDTNATSATSPKAGATSDLVRMTQTLELTHDRITDTITVSGIMPGNSYITASTIEKKDAVMMLGTEASGNRVQAAYDIKVMYKDASGAETEYQPDEKDQPALTVKIETNDVLTCYDSDVYHVDDSGAVKETQTDTIDDSVNFKADSFSPYIITQEQAVLSSNGVTIGSIPGSYNVFNENSGLPMCSAQDNPGVAVNQMPYTNDVNTNQTQVYWSFVPSGSYYIIGLGLANTGTNISTTNYCLNVTGGSYSARTLLQTYGNDNTNACLWNVTTNSDGSVVIHSKGNNNLVVDVPSGYVGSTVTRLQLYTANSTKAQSWILCGNQCSGAQGTFYRYRLKDRATYGDSFIGNATNTYYFNLSWGGLLAGYRRGGSSDPYQNSANNNSVDGNGMGTTGTRNDSNEFMCFDFDSLAAVKSDFFFDNRYGTRWAGNNNFSDKSAWFYCQSDGFCRNGFSTGVSSYKQSASGNTSVGYKYYGTVCAGYTTTYTTYKGQVIEASVGAYSTTGTNNYLTLSAAYSAASSGNTIYMLRHYTFFGSDSGITISKNINLTVNTNVSDDCYIYNTGTAFTNSSTFNIYGNSSAYLYIDGKSSSGTKGISNSGTLTLGTRCYIQNQYTSGGTGGGVYSSAGTVYIQGGSITGCSTGKGGGVYINAGTFNMSSGTISSNTASTSGGGVFIYNNTGHYLTGGTISSNSSSYGNSIFLDTSVTLNLSGSPTISGNVEELGTSSMINYSSTYSGSAIYVQCANGTYNSLSYDLGRKVATRNSTSYTYGEYEFTGSSASSGSRYIRAAGGSYNTYGYSSGIYLGTSFTVTFIDYSGTSQTTRTALGYLGADGTTNGSSVTVPSENSSSYGTAFGWTTSTSSSASSEIASSGGSVTLSAARTYYGLYQGTSQDTFIDASATQYASVTLRRNSNLITSTYTVSSGTVPYENAYSGWTAGGWTTSTSPTASSALTAGSSYSPTGSTYYGLYSQGVTLTYNANGGSSTPAAQTGTRYTNAYSISSYTNPSFTLAAAITKTDYTFQGWSVSSPISATKAAGSVITPASETALTATAAWSLTDYAITYNLDGGTNASSNPGSYNTVSLPLTLAAPTKAGYTFTGWTGSNGTTPQTSVTLPAGSSGDKTYTANWTPTAYGITYSLGGGTVDTPNPTSYTIETDDFTLNNPTMDGYRFTGWTGSNGTTAQTTVIVLKGTTGALTYTANWEKNHYITYDANGGTGAPSDSNIYYSGDAVTVSNTVPLWGSNAFKGWASTPSATAIQYLPSETFIMPDDDVHLYAVWDMYKTLTYDGNGGASWLNAQSYLQGQSVAVEGTKTIHTGNLASDGSVTSEYATSAFNGTQTAAYQNATSLSVKVFYETKDLSNGYLYVRDSSDTNISSQLYGYNLTGTDNYRTWNKYTANITGNAASVYYNNVNSSNVSNDRGYYGIIEPVYRKDYAFKGWNTKADGSGTTYLDGQSLTLSNDTTLYAQWQEETYSVHYNPEYGTGTMDDQVIRRGTAAPLTENVYEYGGFRFAGWDTDPSADTVVYTDRESVTDIGEPDVTVQLYAVWEVFAPTGISDGNIQAAYAAIIVMTAGIAMALLFRKKRKNSR